MQTLLEILGMLLKGALILVGLVLLLGGGSCVMLLIPATMRSHGGSTFGVLLIAAAVAGVGFAILYGLSKSGKKPGFPPEDTISNRQDDI